MTKADTGQKPVTSASADTIFANAQKATKSGPPPVHLWNPPFCGDLDMRIARDGTWFYEGTQIERPALVNLFASILRKDDDAYFLVTPVEKVGLIVEDVPFIAIDFEREGEGDAQTITFTTNVDDVAVAGPDHPIRVIRDEMSGEPTPYVLIRAALEARIDRKSFYRLVELGEIRLYEGVPWFGVRSSGQFFPIIPEVDLEDS